MAKQKHKEFEEYTERGKEFIKLWNKQVFGKGVIKSFAQHFGVSTSLVYRIRIKLGLPDLMNTPARKDLEKRIIGWYHDGKGTEKIAQMYGFCAEEINVILKKHNVQINPQHVTNPLWYKTRCTTMSHTKLLSEIKRLYSDEHMSGKQIAHTLGLDHNCVMRKLKFMNITIRKSRVLVLDEHNKGECLWCGKIFPRYIVSGPRTQLYCCGKCKNQAKDYRRLLAGTKTSDKRMDLMNDMLRKAWSERFCEAVERIVKAGVQA